MNLHSFPYWAPCLDLDVSLTFVHPRILVLYHRQLIDLAKLLEDGLQVFLLQVSGYLPDEELDCVRLLH